MKDKVELIQAVTEVIISAIYHGRHFSPTRDKVVIRKCVDYILDQVNPQTNGNTKGNEVKGNEVKCNKVNALNFDELISIVKGQK